MLFREDYYTHRKRLFLFKSKKTFLSRVYSARSWTHNQSHADVLCRTLHTKFTQNVHVSREWWFLYILVQPIQVEFVFLVCCLLFDWFLINRSKKHNVGYLFQFNQFKLFFQTRCYVIFSVNLTKGDWCLMFFFNFSANPNQNLQV